MSDIRRATVQDLPLLLPLVEDYWSFEQMPGFDPVRVTSALQRLLTEPGLGAGWIATEGGTPTGYLLAVYVFSLEHDGLTAEIDEFYIRPEFRGTGVGHALLAATEAECARARCTNISLQLARGNDAARAFYHRHGFTDRTGFDLLDKTLRAL